jgi:hypothetical protein
MMQYTTDQFYFDPQSLRDFTHYLLATGWKRIKYQNKRLAVYAKELQAGDSPAIVALPERATYSDFSARMVEAVQRLAEVEETSLEDIYQKIQSVGQDCIRLRLKLPAGMALPSLEVTSRFLQGARNLVVYAACMEQEARRYFEQPFHIGKEQAQHFQFDHTFHGSFGFSIKSSLPTFQQLLLPGVSNPGINNPLERRVVERITRGLISVKHAEQAHNSEEISEHFTTGLNGNMCKAVLEMLEEIPDTAVEYSVRWSLSLSPSPDITQFTPVVLDKEVSYYLRDAAQYLEASTTNLERDKTIEGVVTSLNFENQSDRQVTLMADGYGKVSFTLEAEDYATACDAHRDNLMVNVTGTLQRNKRGPWTLLSPRAFHIKP